MLSITEKLLTNKRNRPALRDRRYYSIRKLKGVVAHWTANTRRGADAMANRNYFQNTDRFASAHYIIDDGAIIQCVPDHEVAYHVGGRVYKPVGESLREDGLTPNYFVIGFEMCVNADGDWDKTYQNSVDLAQKLLNKYNFTVSNLYRHYDITGKDCPKMMIADEDWLSFKHDVNKGLTLQLENPIQRGHVNVSQLNVREGNSSRYRIIDTLSRNDKVDVFETIGNWHRVGLNSWVHAHYIKIDFSKKQGVVDVDDAAGLNVRAGAGLNHPVMDVLHDGAPVEIIGEEENWYQIGAARWVSSRYISLSSAQKGRVTAPRFLNVRSGPGTQFDRVDMLANDEVVNVFEERNSWLRVGDEQWVYGLFVRMIGV